MSSKQEAGFIASVQTHLAKNVYTEGMAHPYRGGTPEQYDEGKTRGMGTR